MQQFKPGDTFVKDNVTYVRDQAGNWTPSGGSPSVAPSPAPSIALTGPNPRLGYQTTKDANTAAASSYDPAKAAADAAAAQYNVGAKPTYDRNTAIQGWVDNVRNDARIKTYEQALPIWSSALRAPETPEGDSLLTNAWAKGLDPMTGVQQGESKALSGQAPAIEQVKATLLKEFGGDAGGNFTPEGRRRIKEALTVRMREVGDLYRAARADWTAKIKSAGLPGVDPEVILGPNPGLTYQKAEANFLGRPIRNTDGSQGAAPTNPGLLGRGPGDIGFAGARDQNPFTPDQQARYNAFWQAYPQATEAQLQSFIYNDLGIKDPANVEAIIKARNEGAGVRNAADAMWGKPSIADARGKGGLGESIDAFGRGAADVASLGMSDEIAAGMETLFGDGTMRFNLARQRGIDEYDNEKHFPARFGGQIAGGFALPMGQMATIPQIAGKSAAVGGAYGFGSGEGGIMDRLGSGAQGAIAGGAIGAGLGTAVPLAGQAAVAAGRRFAGPSNPRQLGLLQAATEEGVPLNMSDVYPGTRNTVSTLETIPGASGVVQRSIEEGRNAIEARVQNLARGGTAREDMGEVIQGAGQRFVERSNSQADRLYSRARRLAGDTPIVPQSVMQTLAGLVRQEAGVPGGTRAGAVVQHYADAFQNGGAITVDGARSMRSELLSRLREDGGLSKAAATRLTGEIMRGINDDIERSLTQAGRSGAVQAYRTADRFYAQTREEIEQVTEKFIGTDARPKSVEDTLRLMKNAHKGNAAGMARMLSRLSPDERRDYAATLVEPLGRQSADEPFSPALFIQNIRQVSPAARRVIFGADGERSIHNLVRLSNAKKETVQRLNNSRSGQVSNYRAVLSTLVTGLPGGGALLGMAAGAPGTGAGVATAVGAVGLVGSRGLARALMNEDFTRLLAQAPNTANPRAIQAHLGRMRRLAVQNPSLRGVVENLEQRVLTAVNDNLRAPNSLAASPNEGPDDQQQNPYR